MRTVINRIALLYPHVLTALLGAMMAAGLWVVWRLEGRWFFVAVGAIALVAVAMMTGRHFSDFLLIALILLIPFAGFTKWFFTSSISQEVRDATPAVSGALGIGITDFLLIGLYASWFWRIFVTREAPLPKPQKIDFLILGLVAAYLPSMLGVTSVFLGVSAVEHLVKHVLVYFYLSRHFRRRHIPWLLAAFFLAIALESVLGIIQNRLGVWRGLILDKGSGKMIDFQYTVPGIEDRVRATGTSYDSHTLGLYVAMLLPFSFIMMFEQALRWRYRILSGLIFLPLGCTVLVLTYSRSAWLSSAVALLFVIFVLIRRGERQFVPFLIFGFVACVLLLPWLAGVFERFYSAPTELITARFEQYKVAYHIWLDHLLFGYGPGHYMEAMWKYNINWARELPVHNVILFIAAELGLVGVILFFGVLVAAIRRFWKLTFHGRTYMARRLSAASLAALLAYVVDGLSDPLFRESIVYMMMWVLVALSVALMTMDGEKPARVV